MGTVGDGGPAAPNRPHQAGDAVPHSRVRGRRLARALLLALVAWSAAWAAVDLYRVARLYQNRPWTGEAPSRWRFGAEPVERLAGFLAAAEPHLPPGPASVVFAFGDGPEEERLYGYMWAAYLLPGRTLVQPVGEPADARGWVRYGQDAPTPPERAVLRYSSAAGEVYHLP